VTDERPGTAAGSMRGGWRHWAVRAAQAVVAVVVIFFVYRSMSAQLSTSNFLTLHFSPWYLAASWAMIAAYYLLFATGLMLVIRSLGYRPRFRDVFKLSYAANLGKYVPGGVWQVAGKVAMARQAGVDRHAALVASVVESAVSVTGGLLLFLTTTLFGAPFPVGVPKWPLVVLMVAILVALMPQIFARVVALGMRLLKIEGEPPHLRMASIAWLVLYYAAIWLVSGAAFWLFTRSLVTDPGASWLAYAGFYAVASIGGLLVLFVPAGLGVREGFLVLLVRGVIAGGGAAAVIVAFAARVWSSLMELALSGVAVALPFAGPPMDAGTPESGPSDDASLRGSRDAE
jgi:glycosyltransferase 2 family protein